MTPAPPGTNSSVIVIGDRGNGKTKTIRNWMQVAPSARDYVNTASTVATEQVESDDLVWSSTAETIRVFDTPGELIHRSEFSGKWFQDLQAAREGLSGIVIVAAPPQLKTKRSGAVTIDPNSQDDLKNWLPTWDHAARRIELTLQTVFVLLQQLGVTKQLPLVVHVPYADRIAFDAAVKKELEDTYKQLWTRDVNDPSHAQRRARRALYQRLSDQTFNALPWLRIENPDWAESLHAFVSANIEHNPFHIGAASTTLRCVLDRISEERQYQHEQQAEEQRARARQEELRLAGIRADQAEQAARAMKQQEHARRHETEWEQAQRNTKIRNLTIALGLLVLVVPLVAMLISRFRERSRRDNCAELPPRSADCRCILEAELRPVADTLERRLQHTRFHGEACKDATDPRVQSFRLQLTVLSTLLEPNGLRKSERLTQINTLATDAKPLADQYPATTAGEVSYASWLKLAATGHPSSPREVLAAFTEGERRNFQGTSEVLEVLAANWTCADDWARARDLKNSVRSADESTATAKAWVQAKVSCLADRVAPSFRSCFWASAPSVLASGIAASQLDGIDSICRAGSCAPAEDVAAAPLFPTACTALEPMTFAFLASQARTKEDFDACLARAPAVPAPYRAWLRLLGPGTPEQRVKDARSHVRFAEMSRFWQECWVSEVRPSEGCRTSGRWNIDPEAPRLLLSAAAGSKLTEVACALAEEPSTGSDAEDRLRLAEQILSELEASRTSPALAQCRVNAMTRLLEEDLRGDVKHASPARNKLFRKLAAAARPLLEDAGSREQTASQLCDLGSRGNVSSDVMRPLIRQLEASRSNLSCCLLGWLEADPDKFKALVPRRERSRWGDILTYCPEVGIMCGSAIQKAFPGDACAKKAAARFAAEIE